MVLCSHNHLFLQKYTYRKQMSIFTAFLYGRDQMRLITKSLNDKPYLIVQQSQTYDTHFLSSMQIERGSIKTF